MTRKVLAAGLLFLAMIAGCGKPEDKFVGHWDGKLEVTQSFIDTVAPGLSPDQQNLLRAELAKSKSDLELNKDKTYSLSVTVGGENTTVSGSWSASQETKTITLIGSKPSDADRQEAIAAGATETDLVKFTDTIKSIKVGGDGKTLILTETRNGMTMTILFTKR